MSDEIKVNRTPQTNPSRPEYQPIEQKEKTTPMQSPSKMPWIILGVVVVVLILVGVVFREKLFVKNGAMKSKIESQKPSGYQAMFMTNGQVYFGKISSMEKEFVTITDIYYLQVGPQQGSASQPGQPAQQAQQSISLVKLGNELHGPVDEMHINKTQLLFYEDLKEDGQVVKAILQDKSTKK